MKLDPDTKIGSLLRAVPSSALAFEKLGIATAGNDDKTLQEMCVETGVKFQEFLSAMDEIDWDAETAQYPFSNSKVS